jgi:RNA ligase
MFKHIHYLSDLQAAVAEIKEIRFHRQHNGITIGCYMFMDSKTFDTPEALECRGVAFDDEGKLVSRPLHKFFNLGEKAWLSPEKLLEREAAGEIACIFEKIDGSMIASAWFDNTLHWRSKKAFHSDVVHLVREMLTQPEYQHIQAFSERMAQDGCTVIFELTHPQARIVVAAEQPQMRLLHVRENTTGEYVLLDPAHPVHEQIRAFGVPVVQRFDAMSLSQLLDTLPNMQQQEGYVVQFTNGDMVKIKCPWYTRLHRSITFLRERDIALLALNEELDDVKGALREAGIDLGQVNEVEARLKAILLDYTEQIDQLCAVDGGLDRKDFAIKHKQHPLFGLLIAKYAGKEVALAQWYARNELKDNFTLRVLADGALAEALEG